MKTRPRGIPAAAFFVAQHSGALGGRFMADDPSVLAGTASARFALEQSVKSLSDLILAFEELTERLGDPEGKDFAV